MKILLTSLATGRAWLADAPAPQPGPGQVLVRARRSVVSVGTEGMLTRFGAAGPLGKLRAQPERARELAAKVQRDGLPAAAEAVASKLAQPIPLGYCVAGVVEAVGPASGDPHGLRPGDRVACNAPHAQRSCVPARLCVPIPDGVPDEAAAFTPLAAIAIHATRLAGVGLGARVGVVGAGVIGALAIQALRASGCVVVAVDPDPDARARALALGAASATSPADAGAHADLDAVLVCTAGDASPVTTAAAMCRDGATVVLVGDASLDAPRRVAFAKELTLVVARSYGPGRYDPSYEDRGVDYPVAHARWTAGRNFSAALDLMADGRLDPASLIAARSPFADAPDLYGRIAAGERLGGAAVFAYAEVREDARTVRVSPSLAGTARAKRAGKGAPRVALVGAGNFARRVFAPALSAAGARITSVASLGGVNASLLAREVGAPEATSDVDALLARADLDAVAILTRHAEHADLARRALAAGKSVFVEKPLALTLDQCDALVSAFTDSHGTITCGHNRRFAPRALDLRDALATLGAPCVIDCEVRAGSLDPSHWSAQPEHGGRVLGEVSHWVDLARGLVRAPITQVRASRAGAADAIAILLDFADGSVATLRYLTTHHPSLPKERVEVHCAGRTYSIDDWGAGAALGDSLPRHLRKDKGHAALARAWVAHLRDPDAPPPVPHDELFEVARATISAVLEAGV